MNRRTKTALLSGTILNTAFGGFLGYFNGTAPNGPWWDIPADVTYIVGAYDQLPLLWGIIMIIYAGCLAAVYGACVPFMLGKRRQPVNPYQGGEPAPRRRR